MAPLSRRARRTLAVGAGAAVAYAAAVAYRRACDAELEAPDARTKRLEEAHALAALERELAALDEETLPMWLGKFDGFIGTNGGTYLAKSGGKPALTIADLGLYALMSWLTGGVLDGVSTDWSRFANITAMCAAISAIPEVAEFEAAK